MKDNANVNRVPVPRAVLDGIEAVRLSGMTNMLDRNAVVEIAQGLGYPEAAAWIQENNAEYARAVFHGMRPDDESGPLLDPLTTALEQIAREELGIETLSERRSDRLDFHEVGVVMLKKAMERAYRLGREAR